jgi:addiction module RelE/StbE family toxin
MYRIFIANKKTEKRLKEYISMRPDIKRKLEELKLAPRKANGSHPLHGQLTGKWACWLGSNIRLIFIVDESEKIIHIDSVGTHKIY